MALKIPFLILIVSFFCKVNAADFKEELTLSPALGYSTSTGLLWGGEVSVWKEVRPHWQWAAGLSFSKDQDRQTTRLLVDAIYNFDESYAQSYFVGLGLVHSSFIEDDAPPSSLSLSTLFGKRIVFGETKRWAWKPSFRIFRDSQWDYRFNIDLINFSYSF